MPVQSGKFVALQGDGELRVSRLRSISFRSSSSASSPSFIEARCFVERLQSTERFAERQRVAHQLATTLAGLHANSQDDDALELLKNIQTIGTSMDIPLVLSLLQLAADAGAVQPPDAFTVQLVLSCLTNMCVGSGIGSILTEGDAIRALVNWLLDTEQRTRDYALACIFNLASTTERRLQRCRATLLDLPSGRGRGPAPTQSRRPSPLYNKSASVCDRLGPPRPSALSVSAPWIQNATGRPSAPTPLPGSGPKTWFVASRWGYTPFFILRGTGGMCGAWTPLTDL